MPQELDPHNLEARIEKQIARTVHIMEEAADDDMKDLANILQILLRCLYIRAGTKEKDREPEPDGAAVRKYSTAFRNEARRRTPLAGTEPDDESAPEHSIESWRNDLESDTA